MGGSYDFLAMGWRNLLAPMVFGPMSLVLRLTFVVGFAGWCDPSSHSSCFGHCLMGLLNCPTPVTSESLPCPPGSVWPQEACGIASPTHPPRTDWRHSLWEYPRDPEGCACCECFRIAQSICILFWAMAVIFAHLSLGWWRGNLWGNFVFEFLESFTYLIG